VPRNTHARLPFRVCLEEIIEWFDLIREQITAVLDFAARSLETPAHR
jgi:uncharacterized protein (DUF433 family)